MIYLEVEMKDEVLSYYRLLSRAYQRYLGAEARLMAAREEMRSIFPPGQMPYDGAIGARRSRIRRLYDERTEALLRLQSSAEKFKRAKMRASTGRRRVTEIRLLSVRFD